ncbi:MAG TPA: hypothetical protein VMI94_10435 [Bryobacteraceae bacterium]|nr:hypothetical protein [Bryobacteraceae bacterium]
MRTALAFLFLMGTSLARAATPGFLLGFNYAESFGFSDQAPTVVAVDGSNAIYLLGATYHPSQLPATSVLGQTSDLDSFVLKLSPDGRHIVYLTALGFQANSMAVDAGGNAYIAGPDFVAKLNPAGTALVYQMKIGLTVSLTGIAVDAAGHAYVLGYTEPKGYLQTTPGAFQPEEPNGLNNHAFVVRLNAEGTAFDYATYVTGSNGDTPTGIAVDSSGAAVISGYTGSTDFPSTPGAYQGSKNGDILWSFLTRLLPDGSGLIYSAWPIPAGTVPVAVDPNGNAALVAGAGQLLRFDPQGSLVFSQSTPGIGALAVDAGGNIYALVGGLAQYVVKNSVFTCTPGTSIAALTVFDPTGNLLQSTYLPPHAAASTLALGPGASVNIVGSTLAGFTATQTLAGGGSWFLAVLTPDPAAQPVQLACVTSAASFSATAIAAGEIVSLFGQGLGPVVGTQPVVGIDSGFPSRLADVQVTFNGIAAPLLYVQDGQVNAVVPWPLAGAASAEICVSDFLPASNCLEWPVAEAAPGVFTVDGVHAAALNQDGSINSADNPAGPGTLVSVWATGLGPMTPLPADGAIVVPPLPVNDIQFGAFDRVGGIIFSYSPLATTYNGPAPYLVAGASQINFMVTDLEMIIATTASDSAYFNSNSFIVYVAGN